MEQRGACGGESERHAGARAQGLQPAKVGASQRDRVAVQPRLEERPSRPREGAEDVERGREYLQDRGECASDYAGGFGSAWGAGSRSNRGGCAPAEPPGRDRLPWPNFLPQPRRTGRVWGRKGTSVSENRRRAPLAPCAGS